MPAQDTSKIKDKIVSVLKVKGPSLPVHLSREIESSILFTSAFLSELLSEKRIKISHMRVGNSPLYFIEGQENLLERFSHHLKSKEKDAFHLLKEKRFLADISQEPAIRVALREIKDFAIPFNSSTGLMWRFITSKESEFQSKEKELPKNAAGKIQEEPEEIEKIDEKSKKNEEKTLNIFDKKQLVEKTGKTGKKTLGGKKSGRDSAFFNKLKESLTEKNIEIIDIGSFGKSEIVLKAKENNEDKIIFAFNKKRITEKDIIKAGKKASEYRIPYKIVSLGEPLKKIQELIDSIKNLSSIEKI